MSNSRIDAKKAFPRHPTLISPSTAIVLLLVVSTEIVLPGRLLPAAKKAGVIAHRGVTLDAPANTLPAIQRAIELGCSMVEIDVRYTSDGEIVLMHNETVDQTTNGSGRVSDLNLAQIRSLDAGAYFGKQFVGTKVALLKEAINLGRGKIVLYLDMKAEDPAPTVHLVQKMAAQSMVVFRPWSYRAFAAILAMDSSLRILLDLGDWLGIPEILELLHRRFPTASFSSDWKNWSPEMLQEAQRLGVETYVNILSKDDTIENLHKAVAMGFCYIQTDYQDRLLKILAEPRDQIPGMKQKQ